MGPLSAGTLSTWATGHAIAGSWPGSRNWSTASVDEGPGWSKPAATRFVSRSCVPGSSQAFALRRSSRVLTAGRWHEQREGRDDVHGELAGALSTRPRSTQAEVCLPVISGAPPSEATTVAPTTVLYDTDGLAAPNRRAGATVSERRRGSRQRR